MPKPDKERRRISRAAVNLKAQLQILFPEATFSPLLMEVTICDLTLKGARVGVGNFSTKDCSKVIQGPRLSRLICTLPGQQLPTRLFGKILNFEIRGKMSEGTFRLGLQFGENDRGDLERLQIFLSPLSAGETDPAGS